MRRLPLAVALCGMALGARAEAEGKVELRTLFPQEAEVTAEGGGLSRLVLPIEVLGACRPDLSDLRLFDVSGKEVPFLVDAGAAPPGGVEITQHYEPRLKDAARSEVRRTTGPPLRRERYEFDLPPGAPRSGAWTLLVEPRAPEFVARIDVEAIGAAGTVPVVKEGSIFRLRAPRLMDKTRLPLPPLAGGRLRVTLESEQPSWLEPALRLESARILERGARISVPLTILSVRAADRRTLVELSRPPGIVPDLLRVETATGTFDRAVEVFDERASGGEVGGGETSLGSGRVFRVAALIPVGEADIEVRPARGDRLRVAIDDGDSPALEAPAFSAVIRQPALIFAGRGGTLRFGGGRAQAPRYDLAGLLPAPQQSVSGVRAEAAALLYDPAAVHPARLGAIRPNPAYDRSPALAFAMHAAAEVDRRVFSHVRRLEVPASAEGLSRLRLEPADLAILGESLSDLRVADEAARQWPYLLERQAATEAVPLRIEGPERRERSSRYLLRPAVEPVGFDRLTFDPQAAYFDRAARLTTRRDDGRETVLFRGRLARAVGDAAPLNIDLPSTRAGSMTLEIEDGDDAPLVFRSIQARAPLPEIYLTAPAGRYLLLLGAPGQEAPRYELERVRDVVLAVQSAPIRAGDLEANPDYSLKARLSGSGLRQTVLLWSALIAAVVVLAFLTLRLARREPTAT